MRRIPHVFAAITACIVFALIAGCGTPFFPDTGIPREEISDRATPEGVVRQLVNSYISRRIDMFEELLYSEQDFRFYVELDQSVYSGLTNIQTDRTENVSLNSGYPQNGAYVYLTYGEEKAIHQKLFQQASAISFDEPLGVVSVQYQQSIDGGASVPDSSNAEFAVVRTDNASIKITADVMLMAYGEQAHTFAVGKQVFYLKKDAQGLWRILYWFELSL